MNLSLTRVSNKEHNKWLSEIASQSFQEYGTWISGSDVKMLRNIKNLEDGSPVVFMNWKPGEPRYDQGGLSVCAMLEISTQYWLGKDCSIKMMFICQDLTEIDEPPRLLSQYKPTKSISSLSNTSPFLAVDGVLIGFPEIYPCTQTNGAVKTAWWEVDLESGSQITDVIIYVDNRNGYRLFNFTLKVGNISGGPYAECAHFPDRARNGQIIHLECSQFGRIVRLQLNEEEILSLCEVQVFGYSDKEIEKPPLFERTYENILHIFNTDKKDYDSAKSFCESRNMTLARVIDEKHNKWLTDSAFHLTKDIFWMLAAKEVETRKFVNADGSTLSYSNWMYNEPNNLYNMEDCTFLISSGLWNDKFCLLSYSFICQSKSENRKQLLSRRKPTDSSSVAWGGQSHLAVDGIYSGNYYQYGCTHSYYETKPWWEVQLKTDSLITDIVIYNRDGLESRLSNFSVYVSHNKTSDYELCANYPGMASKVTHLSCNKTGRLVLIQLNTVGYLSLCEVDVYGYTIDIPINNYTIVNIEEVYEGVLHIFSNKLMNYDEAMSHCESMNTTLVRVFDQHHNNWLDNKTQSLNTNSEWLIGITNIESESAFINADGSFVSYLNWKKGEPKVVRSERNCVVSLNDLWQVVDCQEKFNIICQDKTDNKKQLLSYKMKTKQKSKSWNGDSYRAVDGVYYSDHDNIPCSNTEEEDNPWWEVDLQTQDEITDVVIFNRINYGRRLYNFYVYVATNSSTSYEVCAHYPGIATDGEVIHLECRKIGSLVRVQIEGHSYLTLCEVQIFGYPGGEKIEYEGEPDVFPTSSTVSDSSSKASLFLFLGCTITIVLSF